MQSIGMKLLKMREEFLIIKTNKIALFKSGSDPDNYPNVPHLKNLLTSGSGFQTNHNLSFMGGDEKEFLPFFNRLSESGWISCAKQLQKSIIFY